MYNENFRYFEELRRRNHNGFFEVDEATLIEARKNVIEMLPYKEEIYKETFEDEEKILYSSSRFFWPIEQDNGKIMGTRLEIFYRNVYGKHMFSICIEPYTPKN